jgi:hypothetical protein
VKHKAAFLEYAFHFSDEKATATNESSSRWRIDIGERIEQSFSDSTNGRL